MFGLKKLFEKFEKYGYTKNEIELSLVDYFDRGDVNGL